MGFFQVDGEVIIELSGHRWEHATPVNTLAHCYLQIVYCISYTILKVKEISQWFVYVFGFFFGPLVGDQRLSIQAPGQVSDSR
jgi:hypothetical protein